MFGRVLTCTDGIIPLPNGVGIGQHSVVLLFSRFTLFLPVSFSISETAGRNDGMMVVRACVMTPVCVPRSMLHYFFFFVVPSFSFVGWWVIVS